MTDHAAFFSSDLQQRIKERFCHVDQDPTGRERLFFENAGGSLRLKTAVEAYASIDAIPDCAGRSHAMAMHLQHVQAAGADDLRTLLNAHGGSVYPSLTASGAMFDIVRAIAETVPGDNMVTTVLDHPSSFDAMSLYSQRQGKQLRVAQSNPRTGGIDVDDVLRLIDARTCVLGVICASNISGARIDIEQIVRRAREVKGDLHIIVDAVQHAPHSLVDLRRTPVDAITIAPYKFFGCRGSGLSWVSDRAARLPHHRLAGNKPESWNLGSSAPAQFAVVTQIVDHVCWIGSHFTGERERRALFACGIDRIELHERALLARLLDGTHELPGLRQIAGVTVLFDHPELAQRDPILAIAFDRLDATRAVREYEQRGVIVCDRATTSLYSKRMLDSFGLAGTVRVSPLHCHAPKDVDRFLEVTRQICTEF
jgi:cysteine desulfurase/selenocysteine lyase